jgi:DNA topoisomerase-2
MENPEI